jgi:hypothetical protein
VIGGLLLLLNFDIIIQIFKKTNQKIAKTTQKYILDVFASFSMSLPKNLK